MSNKIILKKFGNTKTQFIDGDRSNRYPKREEFVEEGILFLNAESINSGSINVSAANFITKKKFAVIQKGRIRKNDILLTTRGNGIGDCAYVNTDREGIINAQMLILRTSQDEIFPRFLFNYFKSNLVRNYIKIFSSGSAQPQIPIRDLKHLPITLPPLSTQKKIAAILSAYDDLIENNNRRIAILENMAEEIYREWFVRMRFPGHEKVKFRKGIPEGWEIKKLKDIVTLVMGQSPKSEFYNSIGIGLPFNQGVGTYGRRFPRKEIFCSVKGRTANNNDILFSVRAPVGRLNIADCKMTIGRGIAAMKHRTGYNSYLFYMLKTLFSREDVIGNGAIFNSVGKDELYGYQILAPLESLVKKYNDISAKLDLKIETVIKAVNILSKTRNHLLPRLISGKLSVDDLNIKLPSSMEETNG